MSTLAQRIIDLTNAIGADIKALYTNSGLLSSLTTTEKSSLVAAINEVKAGASGAAINDSAGAGNTTNTWSADKIVSSIAAAVSGLVNSAGPALDTLAELAAALGNDANYSTTVATALANRVRYDAAQTLSAGQITQACANIGIGEPDTNFVTVYNTAKA